MHSVLFEIYVLNSLFYCTQCPEGSWDINSNDDDPMPRADEAGLNHHGTRLLLKA